MTSAADLAPATTATQDTVTAAARAVRVAEKTPFELAVAAWRLVCDHRDKREAAGDEEGVEVADQAVDDALEKLLQTRAATVGEIAEKGRIFIKSFLGGRYWKGASPDNPAYLSHLMCASYEDRALIALYQDAAFLSGASKELADAEPVRFVARRWLEETTAGTRARFHWDAETEGLTFTGPGEEKCAAAFAALSDWDREEVKAYFQRQHLAVQRQREQPSWYAPSTDALMVRVYADSTAYTVTKNDPDRRAEIRAQLRDDMRAAVGLPVGLEGFDPEQFALEAYAQGMRFKLFNPAFGPDILHRAGDDRPEIKALSDRFAQLDRHQVEVLTEHLAARQAWAADWVAQVEAQTGCQVAFYDSGLGFGIGTDRPSGLADATTIYNAVTKADALHLKAYAWSRYEQDDASERVMAR